MDVAAPLRRVRAGLWPSLQCGLAASAAWAFAQHVLGHPRPFFASVAAVVALGVSGGGRLRRTAELAVGVAVGVGVGDLLVGVIGQGAWQIGVVVGIALLLVLAIGGGGLVLTQAGLQAVFVVALPRTPHSGLHRWQDALVGGAAALLVAAFLPMDPWRDVVRRRTLYVGQLATMLRETAHGARADDPSYIADALTRGRELEPQLVTWRAEISAGRETARITPLHRTRTKEWDEAERLVAALTLSSRNLRVLVRRVLTSVDQSQHLAPALLVLLDDMASAIAVLEDPDAAIVSLTAIAARLDPGALGATTLADQVVVGQLRVVTLDLLAGLGVGREQTRRVLPDLAT